MSSLICCRAQEPVTRRRLNPCLIGYPQDFRHVSHYGDHNTEVDNLAGTMSSKCGDGVFSQKVHLECIDLSVRNGTQSTDSPSMTQSSVAVESSVSDKISGPPKYAPPPLPPSAATTAK